MYLCISSFNAIYTSLKILHILLSPYILYFPAQYKHEKNDTVWLKFEEI